MQGAEAARQLLVPACSLPAVSTAPLHRLKHPTDCIIQLCTPPHRSAGGRPGQHNAKAAPGSPATPPPSRGGGGRGCPSEGEVYAHATALPPPAASATLIAAAHHTHLTGIYRIGNTLLQAVDAAKKKAIRQHVDVETFQALVSAAHLHPMRGGLRIAAASGGKPAPAPRHFRPDGTIAPPTDSSAYLPAGPRTSSSSSRADEDALRSGSHFARAWRAAPAPADRLRLLRRAVEAGALPRLIRLELSSQMLEEIVGCLAGDPAAATQQAGPERPAAAAAATLDLASAVLRAAEGAAVFAVARAGLSLQGRQRLASLVGALASSGQASSTELQAHVAPRNNVSRV